MIISKHFLLIVGEDGALLIPPDGRGEPVYVAGHSDNVKHIVEELRKKPHTPVIIMADVLAQEIRCEAIPPVGFFDRKNLIFRRLKQAFPETRLAGCISSDKSSAILAGLDEKSPVSIWLKRINSEKNRSGIVCLLPLECCDITTALAPENGQEWMLLLSWQRTGGWRQIVTRNGVPVFTRLTPPLPLDASAKEIAETITRDLQATLDYLSRLGLNDKTQIAVTALMPEHAHKIVTTLNLPVGSIDVMTPYNAAKLLGLEFTPAPDDPTSDILFAAWFMKQPRMRLRLMLPEDKVRYLHHIVKRCGIVAAIVAWLIASASIFGQMGNLYSLWRSSENVANNINSLQQQLAQEQNRLGPVTQPLGRLREALTRKRLFSTSTPAPWAMLRTIAGNMDGNIRFMNLNWQSENNGESMNVTVQIENHSADNTPLSKQEIMDRFKQYTDRLQQTDKQFSFQAMRYPFPIAPGETISNNSSDRAASDQSVTADIVIRRIAP